MKFMNMTNKELVCYLLNNNLYRELSFEEQSTYENEIRYSLFGVYNILRLYRIIK